jgi:hypothetical protein
MHLDAQNSELYADRLGAEAVELPPKRSGSAMSQIRPRVSSSLTCQISERGHWKPDDRASRCDGAFDAAAAGVI